MRGLVRIQMGIIAVVGVGLVTSAFAGRNSKETVLIQNHGSEISREHMTFVLELKKSRQELTFQQASQLTETSPAISNDILQMIRRNVESIDATLDVVKSSGEAVKVGFVSSEKGWSDGNVVFYIPNAQGYRILSSFDEIERLVHSPVHSGFEAVTLQKVDDLLSEFRKDNKSLRKLHEKIVGEDALNSALGILEQEIRRLGAEEKGPILENGSSPKLTHALQDQRILHQIESSNDSDVQWAFAYLKEKGVIKL